MSSEEIDPIRCLDFMRDNAVKYARAKAQRVQIEEFRKVLKARLMRAAEEQGVKSLQAQERDAYADPGYEQHLLALQAAIEEEENLRWLLTAAEAKIECWRSLEASNRGLDRGAR